MYTQVERFCVTQNCTAREAIARMNENRQGIVLVVDGSRRLIGTITDGDIRRAVLVNFPLESKITGLLEQKTGTAYAKPVYVSAGQSKDEYLKTLKKHRLSHLPVLNEDNQVVALVSSSEFVMDSLSSLNAVVMAGGKGTRLFPLTEKLPKPMLPIGEKPLLEIIIDRLRNVGIQNINVTTHHKPESIQTHFKDGKNFGVNIKYVSEDKPLGTAGALGLLEDMEKTTLVINGDILTDVDFRTMWQFHAEHQADLTVAVRRYDFEVPYGVIGCEGVRVKEVKEKPKVSFMVNAGIYLLEPHVYRYIPSGEHYNMTDLIERLIEEKLNVISFPIHEYWLDIGAHAEYERAQEEVKQFNL